MTLPINQILLGNCNDYLDIFLQANEIDLILTDPPYGIPKKSKNRDFYGNNGHQKLWGKEGDVAIWDILDQPAINKLVNQSYSKVIIWGGNNYQLPASRCWFIWDKLQSNYGSDCEMAWTNLNYPQKVFRMSRIDAYVNKAEFKKEHPAQKPIQLMEWCIGIAKLKPNSLVFDPFCGTGITCIAAKKLGHRFIGIEQIQKYYDISIERLKPLLINDL